MHFLRCRSDTCRPLRDSSAILPGVLHGQGINGAIPIQSKTGRSKGYGALLTGNSTWGPKLLGVFRRITGGSGGYSRGFAFNGGD